MKKPAHRGATAGLSNAFRQVSVERYAPTPAFRQDLYVARRFGLPPATAAAIADLAYTQVEHWSARR